MSKPIDMQFVEMALIGHEKRLKALERLSPAGTESSVLLAEERSGSDSKRPLTDASGSRLPDPAEAIGGETEVAEFEAWLASDEGARAADWLNMPIFLMKRAMRERLSLAFRAGVEAQARHGAAAQSGEEAAQADCPKCEAPPHLHDGCDALYCPMYNPPKRAERSESGNQKGQRS